MADDKLIQFLNSANNWDRMPTSLSGVFLLKLPPRKAGKASLCVEVNPVDSSGTPSKKRGVVIRSKAELDQIKKILREEKMQTLMQKIEEINPQEAPKKSSSSEVYEI